MRDGERYTTPMKRVVLGLLLALQVWCVADAGWMMVNHPASLEAFAFAHVGAPSGFWAFCAAWIAMALAGTWALLFSRRWGFPLLLAQVTVFAAIGAFVVAAARADPAGAGRAYEASRVARGMVTSPERIERAFREAGLRAMLGELMTLALLWAGMVAMMRDRFSRADTQ